MVSEKEIKDALKEVIEPELGFNIVDLGLVYDVKVKGNNVRVLITLLCPSCHVGQMIVSSVEEQVRGIKGVKKVTVEITNDPPWTPEKATPEIRKMFEEQE